MVGKLIKHELRSILRIAIIPAIVMIVLAILSRIMLETSNGSTTFIIVMFYIYSVLATILIGFCFGIRNFYETIFTGTGYLTLSLPVTADQLILSKLISAITITFASYVVSALSACIFFIGASVDIWAYLGDFFVNIANAASNNPLLFTEIIILGIISIPASFLVLYAIMSVSQLFTVKNRKVIAVLIAVGLYFTVGVLFSSVLFDLFITAKEISIHGLMWGCIIFTAAVDVGCYFLVRHIIKNKINLLA